MAEESNVHVKVAMADVLGLLAIAFFTFLVAGLGLDLNGAAPIAAVAVPVGIVVLIVAFIAFLNENLLGTAIFGPLGIFFLAFVGIHTAGVANGMDAVMALVFIGVVVLIDAVVSFAQPVKLLPILLLVAAVAFFVTALFYNGMTEMQVVFGALWMIYSLISFYMAAAIMMLVLKGKQILPLLISAPSAPAKA